MSVNNNHASGEQLDRAMTPTRRQYLLGSAALIGGTGIASTVLAQDSLPPIKFVEINAEGEYVVIRNVGLGGINLSGYKINFEVADGTDQIRTFPDGTTVAGGGTLTIATGAKDVPGADVEFDYERSELNDETPDTVAILTPNDEPIIRSDERADYVSGDTTTPTATSTPTAEPTEASEPTETPTAEPTETPAPEPTETEEPTETPPATATPKPAEEPTDEPC